jgi:hypothetical protein
MTLTTYWIELDPSLSANELPAGTKLGCGVTAESRDDAIDLMWTRVFSNVDDKPKISRIVSPVDFDTIDQKHVLPNIGNFLLRGIWYPLGYAER